MCSTKPQFVKQPLLKCPTCPKGNQWHGVKTFIDTLDGVDQIRDNCRQCRQKGLS